MMVMLITKRMVMMVMMWTVLTMRMRRVVMRMMMKQDFTSPGFLWVFGTRQRTKWGSQL